MRFRHRLRRRRGISRRPGMKGDWVTLLKTECPFSGQNPNPCDTAPESLLEDTISLIDDQDVQEKQDSLTIVRMVGALNPVLFASYEVTAPLSSPVGGIIACHEGIYKSADGGLTDTILNPYNPGDFERDNWLWLRETAFNLVIGGDTGGFDNFVLAGGAGTTSPPSSPQFDVRVKRRLSFGENLLYCWCWTVQLTLVPAAQGGSLPTSVLPTFANKLTGALRGYVKF